MKPEPVNKPTFDTSDLGTYFDSSRGIYIGVAVIELAESNGWDSHKGDSERVNPLDSEWYGEMTDEAIDFLQSLTLDGLWWGYSEHGGDFGLWLVDCDRCNGQGELAVDTIAGRFRDNCPSCHGTGNTLQIKL